MTLLRRFLLILGSILFSHPTTSWTHSSHSQWYKHYRPIDHPDAQSLLKDGLHYAIQIFGQPTYPIHDVHLRLSQPLNPQSNLKRNFRLTEINDLKKGSFSIYLTSEPQNYSFIGQLGHEILHLLNPNIYDAYYEGLCTVFAEEYAKHLGHNWQPWAEYLNDPKNSFYGLTYRMMREITDVTGLENLVHFHHFIGVQNNDKAINIKAWIQSLPHNEQHIIRDIILTYSPSIQKAIKKQQYQVAFQIPHHKIKVKIVKHEQEFLLR